MSLGIGYIEAQKQGISYDINSKEFDVDEFIFTNPTNSIVTINPFNPQQANLFNIPTSPVAGNTPQTFNPIRPALFDTQAIAYNSNLKEIWGGNYIGAEFYVYDIANQTFINYSSIIQNNITAISYSPVSDKMAIGSSLSNFLTIINATTKAIITSVNLGVVGVNSIKHNTNNNTWVISQNNQVVVLDCVTNAIIATIALLGTTPERIAITSANFAYTPDSTGNNILKIDLNLNALSATIASPLASPFAVGLVSSLNKLYVGSNTVAGIWSFNTTTDTFTANVLPTELASDFYLHSATLIYAVSASAGVGRLSRINVLTNSLQGFTLFPQTVNRLSLAYSNYDGYLYSSSVVAGIKRLNSFTPLSSTLFYVGGSTDYNFFVRDGFVNPYWIRRIYFYSSNPDNFNQTFFLISKDANGNECYEPKTPSLSVATMQYQAGFGMLDFELKDGKAPFIIGVNQWLTNVTLQPNSQIKMVILYQQMDKTKLLTSENNVNLLSDVNEINQPMKFSEAEILQNRVMPLNSQEVKPFDLGAFNETLLKNMKENVI